MIEVDAKLLLDHGADINAIGNCRWTPLHLAAISGNFVAAKTLIEGGADLDARG